MTKASWILLTILGAVIVLAGLLSSRNAYGNVGYRIGPVSVRELAGGRPEVESALRGTRGTAAAYAVAYGVLFLSIVLGPYRRGETWAWWALLAGALALLVIAALRIPTLGTSLGLAAPLTMGGVVLVGLLLDVGRLSRRAA
jgi:hypothetical protein